MGSIDKALAAAKDQKLGLLINGKNVGNGDYVPRKDTEKAPQLTLANPKGPYLAVCIDLDAPFLKFPFLGPILHWLQPGLQPAGSPSTSETSDLQQLNAGETSPVAAYAGAGPPPLSGPHRYLFILYEQPEGFDPKKLGQPEEGKAFPITKRMRYDFEGFVRDSKVGEVVAANWFVSN